MRGTVINPRTMDPRSRREAHRPLSGGSSGEEEDAAFLRDVDDAQSGESRAVARAGSRRNWVAFFILGTINNLGYVHIASVHFQRQRVPGLHRLRAAFTRPCFFSTTPLLAWQVRCGAVWCEEAR